MLPKFEIPTEDAACRVESSFNYCMGLKTSTGQPRLVKPVQICGANARLTNRVARDALARGHGQGQVGFLGFRELVPERNLRIIGADFFDFAYAGIDPCERLFWAVRHQKLLKQEGTESHDIHFGFSPILTVSGHKFLPYFPGADRFGFEIWAEMINYRFNLASPFDPDRRRLTNPRLYPSDQPKVVEFKKAIGELTKSAWNVGKLSTPSDIEELILSHSAVKSAVAKRNGLEVEVAEIQKPIFLAAPIFAPDFDGDKERAKRAKLKRRSKEEVERLYREILVQRANRHFQQHGKPKCISTYRFLEQSNILSILPPTYHEDTLRSNIASKWRPLLDAQRRISISFDRVGIAFGRAIQLMGALSSDVAGRSRAGFARTALDRPTTGRVDDRGRDTGQDFIPADTRVTGPDATIKRNRTPPDSDGEIAERTAEITTRLNRIRQRFLTFPSTAEAVELQAVRRTNVQPQADKNEWFLPESDSLIPGLQTWLRKVDPDGLERLLKTLKVLARFKALSPWPQSAAAVENAVARFVQTNELGDNEKTWFVSLRPIQLVPKIDRWIRANEPPGECERMDCTISAAQSILADRLLEVSRPHHHDIG